jgi:hypothetical protein
MLSEERRSLIAEKDKCTYSPAEVRASTRSVLDLLLSNENKRGSASSGVGDAQEGGGHQAPPPAKYKTSLIVLASLYASTMALRPAWTGTRLERLPFPLQSAVKVFVMSLIMGYALVPIASILLSRRATLGSVPERLDDSPPPSD